MKEELREMLLAEGATLVGVADVSALDAGANRGFARAVSIGVALDAGVIGRIPSGPHAEYVEEYRARNAQLNALSEKAAQWLEKRGHRAFAAGATVVHWQQDAPIPAPPHKTAARLAGHGWIGKNALLITREYGCAVRYCTVYTDAPLAADTPVAESRCGGCTACQDACPGGVIHGRNWAPGSAREDLVDAPGCEETVAKRGLHLAERDVVCGLCIAACPHTQQYLKRAGAQ